MNLITGYLGKPHVKTLEDAMWHRGIWKDDCIISVGENLKAEIISNNEIRVRSGILNMQGKFCSIDINTYDSLTINNGTAGEKRIDLIVARYEKNNETQVEDVSLKVIQGTPSTDTAVAPSYTEGNIDNGDLVAELPLYEVHIEGINITEVKRCLDIVYPLSEVRRDLLFEGAVNGGNIVLSDNIYNYRFLIMFINSSPNEVPFGYGIYPVLITQPASQVVLFCDTTDNNNQSTYMGRLTNTNETTLTITQIISNVRHITGQNHLGGSTYYIRQIQGIR